MKPINDDFISSLFLAAIKKYIDESTTMIIPKEDIEQIQKGYPCIEITNKPESPDVILRIVKIAGREDKCEYVYQVSRKQ